MVQSLGDRSTLPALVARHAAENEDRLFFHDVVRGSGWTYGQVDLEARRWAAAYRAMGIGAGDRVLTMLTTRAEFFLSWLGLGWLRAADVPINTEYKGEMLRHVLENSGARVLLVEEMFLERVVAVLPAGGVERVVVLGEGSGMSAGRISISSVEDWLAPVEPLREELPPALHDVVSVVYTSGTTGPSKGVVQPWGLLRRNALVLSEWSDHTFAAEDAFYFMTPPYHQMAKIAPFMAGLSGGRFAFREKFSVNEFWNDIRRFDCTWTTLVGVMAPFLANHPEAPSDRDNPLRLVIMVPVLADVDAFKERFGVEVVSCYGMTEVAPPVTSGGYGVSNRNHLSCGRPIAGYQVRIVDENDYEVTAGEVGEMIVRADEPWELNLGYLQNPIATAEAWRNGWFHTGDAFRCDEEGNFYFVDRLKDAIRRRGENVSSMEVESLVNLHPDVMASAAIAAPSEYSEDEIKVCVVRRPGSDLTPEALIEFLIPIMPRFMVPRYVEFFPELPQTPTNRTRKIVLRKTALNENTWDREAAGISLPR